MYEATPYINPSEDIDIGLVLEASAIIDREAKQSVLVPSPRTVRFDTLQGVAVYPLGFPIRSISSFKINGVEASYTVDGSMVVINGINGIAEVTGIMGFGSLSPLPNTTIDDVTTLLSEGKAGDVAIIGDELVYWSTDGSNVVRGAGNTEAKAHDNAESFKVNVDPQLQVAASRAARRIQAYKSLAGDTPFDVINDEMRQLVEPFYRPIMPRAFGSNGARTSGNGSPPSPAPIPPSTGGITAEQVDQKIEIHRENEDAHHPADGQGGGTVDRIARDEIDAHERSTHNTDETARRAAAAAKTTADEAKSEIEEHERNHPAGGGAGGTGVLTTVLTRTKAQSPSTEVGNFTIEGLRHNEVLDILFHVTDAGLNNIFVQLSLTNSFTPVVASDDKGSLSATNQSGQQHFTLRSEYIHRGTTTSRTIYWRKVGTINFSIETIRSQQPDDHPISDLPVAEPTLDDRIPFLDENDRWKGKVAAGTKWAALFGDTIGRPLQEMISNLRTALTAETAKRTSGDDLQSIEVRSASSYQTALNAQANSDQPLEMVILEDISGSRGGNPYSYKSGDVLWFAPRSDSPERRFNILGAKAIPDGSIADDVVTKGLFTQAMYDLIAARDKWFAYGINGVSQLHQILTDDTSKKQARLFFFDKDVNEVHQSITYAHRRNEVGYALPGETTVTSLFHTTDTKIKHAGTAAEMAALLTEHIKENTDLFVYINAGFRNAGTTYAKGSVVSFKPNSITPVVELRLPVKSASIRIEPPSIASPIDLDGDYVLFLGELPYSNAEVDQLEIWIKDQGVHQISNFKPEDGPFVIPFNVNTSEETQVGLTNSDNYARILAVYRKGGQYVGQDTTVLAVKNQVPAPVASGDGSGGGGGGAGIPEAVALTSQAASVSTPTGVFPLRRKFKLEDLEENGLYEIIIKVENMSGATNRPNIRLYTLDSDPPAILPNLNNLTQDDAHGELVGGNGNFGSVPNGQSETYTIGYFHHSSTRTTRTFMLSTAANNAGNTQVWAIRPGTGVVERLTSQQKAEVIDVRITPTVVSPSDTALKTFKMTSDSPAILGPAVWANTNIAGQRTDRQRLTGAELTFTYSDAIAMQINQNIPATDREIRVDIELWDAESAGNQLATLRRDITLQRDAPAAWVQALDAQPMTVPANSSAEVTIQTATITPRSVTTRINIRGHVDATAQAPSGASRDIGIEIRLYRGNDLLISRHQRSSTFARNEQVHYSIDLDLLELPRSSVAQTYTLRAVRLGESNPVWTLTDRQIIVHEVL